MSTLISPLPKGMQPLPCLADHVRAIAQATPDAPAMIFGARHWTYGELDRQVSAVARWLIARGFKKGDCLVTLSRPRPEYLVLFLATGKIGGVWTGLNPRYSLPERAWVLNDAKPRFLAFQSPRNPDETAALAATVEAASSALEATIVLNGKWPGATSLETLFDAAASMDSDLAIPVTHLQPDDPALLVYTSGSTGQPKGALISHYGLTFGSLVQATQLRVPQPRVICDLPISHIGCVADVAAVTLVQGGSLVFHETFSPDETLAAIERDRITTWIGVPSMFQMIVSSSKFATTDLSSVRLVLWGGAAMPKSIIDTLRGRGLRLKAAYGLTETSCHVAFTDDSASTDVLAQTIGHPTPYIRCRVVDDRGELCPPGTPGELQIHGRQNFVGYLNNAHATRAAFTPDGWLRSGDLALWTPTQNLSLVGRLHEMYKSGGYSIFPREIELAIEAHPEVTAAAVVGVTHPLYQEVGVAFVVGRKDRALTITDLSSFLRLRLANFKIPKVFELVADLPRLPIGKVDKHQLKARAQRLLDEMTHP